MTLLEKLRAHRGGLLRIKSELYWYDGRGFDGNPGHICLLLDADADAVLDGVDAVVPAVPHPTTAVLLLVDGSPRWVLVNEESVELLDGGDQ